MKSVTLLCRGESLKHISKLSKSDQICMVISAGKRASNGVYGKRIRFRKENFIKEV